MIEIRGLTFSYHKENVLNSIDLTIEDGKLTAIMGENGSGKTTLIKNLLGSLSPKMGNILIDGDDIGDLNDKKRSSLFSYIPQSIDGVFNFYAMDVVLFGLAGELGLIKTPGKEELIRADQAFDRLGINHLKYRKLSEISGGERQMILIARSLVRDTPYIIMDEPTSSLDYRNQLNVMEIAKNLSKDGKTVILSTHNPSFALFYTDNTIILKDGMIYKSGKSSEVINEENLSFVFDRDINFATVDGKKIIYP